MTKKLTNVQQSALVRLATSGIPVTLWDMASTTWSVLRREGFAYRPDPKSSTVKITEAGRAYLASCIKEWQPDTHYEDGDVLRLPKAKP